jgi:hypothetical protein
MMKELGSNLAFEEDNIGAAPLWIVSTRTGDAEANKGKTENAKRPFMTGRGRSRTVGLIERD